MSTTESSKSKHRLLLHVCCIGCGAHVAEVLMGEYDVTLFFYNPNIFPQDEYKKRLEETEKVAKKLELDLITGDYDHEAWLNKIKGHEHDPERGERCMICYRDRLESTDRFARGNGFDYFTTTLTISPHKDARAISRIGNELADESCINFLDRDFKKKDGFKKSVALSRELGLYRQNYCGCEFSRR